VNDPDIFKIDGEVSMINFIVLSSDLDFGYLSYRKTINKEAYYLAKDSNTTTYYNLTQK
jgi:hypothetical protein